MKLGIEAFISEKQHKALKNHQVAFLGHSASVAQDLTSSLSLILTHTPLKISCVISPQHGFHSVEQANMITTEDAPPQPIELNRRVGGDKGETPFVKCDSVPNLGRDSQQSGDKGETPFVNRDSILSPPWDKNLKCPIFSLYSSKNRRLTKEMLDHFDVLIVDLQDVGCRVYTYLTTLLYALEDLAHTGKQIWVLDRPNPAGRNIEGFILNKNFLSFVGAGPLPLRHGLSLGEVALWYRSLKNLNVDLKVVKMQNYFPEKLAWPTSIPWVLPSPNMVDKECALSYSGTVLLEGTQISEARGTVFPLKAFGFPNMKAEAILKLMVQTEPKWLKGCVLRKEHFKPQFDKFQNKTCSGIRIYTTLNNKHLFKPFRLISLFLKCLKKVHPSFDWKTPPPYEYEYKKWPIDILSGDDFLRKWVENPNSTTLDFENKAQADETLWAKERTPFLLY